MRDKKERKTYKGKFTPRFPQKYKGNLDNIIFRSGWECKMMKWLDETPAVLEWSSEEVVIPYVSPMDGRYHRYFVDFYARIKERTGVVTYLMEVKPYKETVEPKRRKKITPGYINEIATWGVNSAKWKAAEEFCEERDWVFRKVTEKELFG